MNHIRFIIAKQLLEDRKKEVVKSIKPNNGNNNSSEHYESYEAAKRELRAIDAELFLLNNW